LRVEGVRVEGVLIVAPRGTDKGRDGRRGEGVHTLHPTPYTPTPYTLLMKDASARRSAPLAPSLEVGAPGLKNLR